MRTFLAASAALVALTGAGSAATLNVASYNIKHGLGADGAIDLGRQAAILSQLDPDVVALQEVDIETGRANGVDQPSAFAEELSLQAGGDWRALPAPAIAYDGGAYGNALLYDADRLDLTGFDVLGLPGSEHGDGARSASHARFSATDGLDFEVFGTHLTHLDESTGPQSTLQTDALDLIDEAAGVLPSILMGDLNAAPGSDTIAHLEELGWRIDSPLDGTSFVGGDSVIDYVATRGADALAPLGAEILVSDPAAAASDHYPLAVRYEYEAAAPAPVPLPAGAPLALSGLAALGGLVLRRRR